MIDVVILAGGKCPEELKNATGCEMRADLTIAGERIIDRVVRAFTKAATGGRIIVVGSKADGTESVPAGHDFIESLQNGIERTKGTHAIVSACDIPFVKAVNVQEFLKQCLPGYAFSYPIIPVALCKEKFPMLRRTTIKTREGVFTGGNWVHAELQLLRESMPVIQHAYENRKSPFKLAKCLGPGLLFRVLIGQILPSTLSLKWLEDRVGRFLNHPVRAVLSNDPEIATDIDSLEQYREAVKLLENLKDV